MAATAAWEKQELTRFFRAFHKYGTAFDKVSMSVGGGKSPEMCEALFRQHQPYLTLDRKFQSDQAFVAMCEYTRKQSKEGQEDGEQPAAEAAEADPQGLNGRAAGPSGDDEPAAAPQGSEGYAAEPPSEPASGPVSSAGGGLAHAGGASEGTGGGGANAGAPATGRRSSRGKSGLAAALLAAEKESEDEDLAMLGEASEEDGEGDVGSYAAGGGRAGRGPAGGGGRGGRPRRTPQRSAAARTPPGTRTSRRTPQSSAKRPRGSALRDDDIYEYYDPALEALTESARKRRASAKRLDFAGSQQAAAAGLFGGRTGAAAAAGGRRREAAEEAKGIDALLSLAEAGEEFGQEEEAAEPGPGPGSAPGSPGGGHAQAGEDGGGGVKHEQTDGEQGEVEKEEGEETEAGAGTGEEESPQPSAGQRQQQQPPGSGLRPAAGRGRRRKHRARRAADEFAAAGEEEEEEFEGEEGEEGGAGEEEEEALDDVEDEDYTAPTRRRRTPTSTPLRTRSRPGSTHVTPRRSGLRGLASPGLRGLGSPAWLGLSDTELGMDLGLPDLSYLGSPGFPTPLPPGFLPSPKDPLPRRRQRKYAPIKSPPVVSPFKSLFGSSRRHSLGPGPGAHAHLFGGGGGPYGAGASAGGAAGEAREGAGVVMAPLEVQLRHCLNARVRRWCQFEFFYSAIDRPWFLANPLQALLAHLGLGSVSKLTRKEWSLVRVGLGRPRRLSLKFLKDERARLEAWRESVRAHYAAAGSPAAPPADTVAVAGFPRALNVGQRVTARHPTTRQIHDGSVLTAAPNSYRIQFDRRELGVELVRDCDIMPAEPAENLPQALLAASPVVLLNGRYMVGGQLVRPPAPRTTIFPLAISSLPAVAPTAAAFGRPTQQPQPQQQQQPALMQQQAAAASQQAQQQSMLPGLLPQAAVAASAAVPAATALAATPAAAGPPAAAAAAAAAAAPAPDSAPRGAVSAAEAQALAELTVCIERKEALLAQLRLMNDDAQAGVHDVPAGAAGAASGSGGGKDSSQPFKLAYAKVVLQLRDASERVASKLVELEALRRGEGATPVKEEAEGTGRAAAAAEQAHVATPGPETPDALAASCLLEARSLMKACSDKLKMAAAEAAAAEAAGMAQPPAGVPGAVPTELIDWERPQGRLLGGVIEGCIWSLLALQRGCAGGVPAATLAGALDTALQSVRPHAAANQQLYNDIRQAVEALRSQLLLVSS